MALSQKLLALAAAGALGTLSRYALSGAVQRFAGSGFPWGTLVVNSAGCFLFGLVWSFAEKRIVSPEARVVTLVGFMGAFTTFSSFAFETGELLRDSQHGLALLNITAQNAVGIGLFFAGLFLGRVLS
jgi:CrcB protein